MDTVSEANPFLDTLHSNQWAQEQHKVCFGK